MAAKDISSFRWVFLPYCLLRQADGSYVVCNRRYKPVGITRIDWVDFEEYPVRVKIKRMSVARARKLDHAGRENLERIYLYDDGSVPTASAANWATYSKRLQLLASFDVTAVKPVE